MSTTTGKTIRDWQREVHAMARSKGFHDAPPDPWRLLALITTEIGEAIEELRKPGYAPTRVYHREDGKPEGLGAELADVVIRVMDTCAALGIDLEAAMRTKAEFNATREHRHGKLA